MGFEPTTFWATTRRSNQLSYTHHILELMISCGSAFYNSTTPLFQALKIGSQLFLTVHAYFGFGFNQLKAVRTLFFEVGFE